VTALLRYDLSGQEADLDVVATASNLKRNRIVTLADFLLGDAGYETLLELQYGVTPTDRPEIAFKRQDGTFAPLNELSTGQKCTAFLVMALCEGDAPIVVDQPEDSLDIRSIWSDMCVRLRSSKRDRQFAFTTHNSSLAVASDSDKFVVLTADAHHGEVVRSGAIDSEEVRREVIELLEGGQSTYFLKQRKYNVSDPYVHGSD
jgi:ABC-type enterochelin transport system ATPase subunit